MTGKLGWDGFKPTHLKAQCHFGNGSEEAFVCAARTT